MAKKRYPNSKQTTSGTGRNKMRKYLQKYFHILKLRILEKFGFKLTSNERGELARWITRNVTESTAETLRKVRSGAPIETADMIYRNEYECGFEADENFG